MSYYRVDPTQTSAVPLLAHLERGGFLIRGDPHRITALHLEVYREQKSLWLSGWGSALMRATDMLEDVLLHPEHWFCAENADTAREFEEKAAKVFPPASEEAEACSVAMRL